MTKSLSEIQQEIISLSPFSKKVKLLAVSKKQSTDKIYRLYQQGQRLFGENYLQEALSKITELKSLTAFNDPIEWHFIGHLQSNKINQTVGNFSVIHSIDSLKKVELVNTCAFKKNLVQKILLEINIGEEDSKNGFLIAEIVTSWKLITNFKNIKIEGLMCLPPQSDEPKIQASFFIKMRLLLEQLNKLKEPSFPLLTELSMGTSGDYQIALKEGATIIRLGTILFGERG
ncbi:MAG: YggS family pyridoxal phosphate-dependent enzyme [Bdellovibrionaceae bacterium]|nr:YggS family pyridoxal phosphate-dependent enzyme [Pseudobdellovibrionaceae bacterium]NUM60114.1 YggS family pyridoxal phosphate-dependent enzyme [Pseudobdellovibrionaceae bacterium]